MFSTKKIPRILNHKLVQGGDLISWLCRFVHCFTNGLPAWKQQSQNTFSLFRALNTKYIVIDQHYFQG